MYADEIYKRYKFGIKSMSDEAMQNLQSIDRRQQKTVGSNGKKITKYIHGDSSYDMLTSVNYQQAFQYQTLDMRNQKEDFELSDMITRALHIDGNISKPENDAVKQYDKVIF